MNLRNLIIAAACVLPLAACAANEEKDAPAAASKTEVKADVEAGEEASAKPVKNTHSDISSVYSEMALMTAKASCSIDTDCDVMPVGHRACGGPSGFVPYSNKMNADDLSSMQVMAERTTELAREINEASGMMSTCDVMTTPEAVCLNQQCVIAESSDELIVR